MKNEIQQFAKRLVGKQDLRLEIQRLAREQKITAGCIISGVGNLQKANIRLADGKTVKKFNESLEIVSINGTISEEDCHIHISFANKKGNVFGGHLKEGCIVGTTAEIVVLSIPDMYFFREKDKKTNYNELVIEPIINRPKVGLGVYIFNNKKELLLLKRKGAHGSGSWCPPGGHLEFGESFHKCAKREAKEELGITVSNIEFMGLTNDIFDKEKHYITIAVRAVLKNGKPKLMEPEKCTEFGWYSLNKLPKPLFLPVKQFLAQGKLE